MSNSGHLELRAATLADVQLINRFIHGLADYERLAHECRATESLLSESLFGPNPAAEVVLAFYDDEPAGFALFFHNYSTFLAQRGIYLEDLFVDPAHRGKGIGQALLSHLASLALARGCLRLEWSVLDWNEDAIRFYKHVGARAMSDWTVYRVTDEALEALAARHSHTRSPT